MAGLCFFPTGKPSDLHWGGGEPEWAPSLPSSGDSCRVRCGVSTGAEAQAGVLPPSQISTQTLLPHSSTSPNLGKPCSEGTSPSTDWQPGCIPGTGKGKGTKLGAG